MKVTLGIQDALVLRSMLLEMGGGYAELVLARKTAEQVFSAKELEEYQVKNVPEGVLWNTTAKNGKALPVTKTVEFGPEAHGMIAAAFKKLDEAKALKQYHIGLYEQFVQPKTKQAAS